MDKKTYVALVLDKSGSMAGTRQATIAGFNEQVQQLKLDSKDQEIYCSFVSFNANVYEHFWNVPAEDLKELTTDEYSPDGGTAMYDAVGYTTKKLLETTDNENSDNAYLIVTISDGETNSDRHYNASALKEIVQSCEKTGKWTFTYVGCSKEYLEGLSRATGTPVSNMASWSNADANVAACGFLNVRKSLRNYTASRLEGDIVTTCYASGMEGQVADYTKEDPSTEGIAKAADSTGTVLPASNVNVWTEPANLTNVIWTGNTGKPVVWK